MDFTHHLQLGTFKSPYCTPCTTPAASQQQVKFSTSEMKEANSKDHLASILIENFYQPYDGPELGRLPVQEKPVRTHQDNLLSLLTTIRNLCLDSQGEIEQKSLGLDEAWELVQDIRNEIVNYESKDLDFKWIRSTSDNLEQQMLEKRTDEEFMNHGDIIYKSNGSNGITNSQSQDSSSFDETLEARTTKLMMEEYSRLTNQMVKYFEKSANPAKLVQNKKLEEITGLNKNIALRMFQMTDLNASFTLCPSYPRYLLLPRRVFKDTNAQCHPEKKFLKEVSRYRSKQRIPAVVYIDYLTRATISRSAQPLTGILNFTSDSDTALLGFLRNRIRTPRLKVPPPCLELDLKEDEDKEIVFDTKLHIVDCRPYQNAAANKVFKGAGFETALEFAELTFSDIQNIHAMRDSYEYLSKASMTDITFLAELTKSNWFHHTKRILEAAKSVRDSVCIRRKSVLVHCSDGWDRTSQICSLAQLLLDPHYRTLQGFLTLIQKEWYWFGHKFGQRLGNSSMSAEKLYKHINRTAKRIKKQQEWFSSSENPRKKPAFQQICHKYASKYDHYSETASLTPSASDSSFLSAGGDLVYGFTNYFIPEHNERSPVFLQFLDCVYQIMVQFPCDFEFNQLFLFEIVEHVVSGRFLDFLSDNQKERFMLDEMLRKASSALDADAMDTPLYLIEHMESHIKRNSKKAQTWVNTRFHPKFGRLNFDCSMSRIQFWTLLFDRFDDNDVDTKHRLVQREIKTRL